MAMFRFDRCWVVLLVVVLASGLLGVDPAGAVAGSSGGGVAAVGGFSDVGEGGVHAPAVEALEVGGVFEGTECGEGLFCPGEPVLRWVMAVWLIRVLGEEPVEGGGSRFADVDGGVWWAPYVEALADVGVTKGCATGPLRFCPEESVTRAQMASFLVRAFGLEAAGSAGFADTAGSTHEANIDALAAGRVTAGCATGPLRYCPAKAVTRAQMATFLARATGSVAIPETGSGSGGGLAAGVVEDVFDPFTTPAVSDLDLGRLGAAVATLDETVDCPPVVGPDSLDDVAEVVRIADGCMVVEYELLRGRTVGEVREALSADPSVHAVGLPPRDIYPDQSRPALDTWQDYQWYLGEVNAEDLWDSWPTGAEVTVAVIDSGVAESNVDLKDRLIDTGHVCHRQDTLGHGTHVAGIVAAERGNLGPVIGVAPEARILPIKTHLRGDARDQDCDNDVPTLTAAITRAMNEGADVINMSLRFPLEEDGEGQDTAELAIRAATMDGIVVVVSAGNCGSDDPDDLEKNNCEERNERHRPAVYPGVIAVAATGEDRLRAPYSSFTRDVDIAAPGGVARLTGSGRPEVMLSTWPAMIPCIDVIPNQPDVICWSLGTSQAAPVVSGVVAHLKARYPDATVAEVQYALYSTADRKNDDPSYASYRSVYGHGFINPKDAVDALEDLKRRVGDFVEVSSGNGHTCGLGTNGVVECWGDNDDGQANAPSGIFTAVSAGGFHSCAIRQDDRTVECWGNNDEGQTNAPPRATRVGRAYIGDYFIAVSAGRLHSCGIRYSGTVECWGSDGHNQTTAPDGDFTEVSAGAFHTCGLLKPTGSGRWPGITRGGTIQCWGHNDYGQTNPPEGNFVAVSAGRYHSCGKRAGGIRAGGEVECWGYNASGQTDAPGGGFTSVSAGGFHTCGITRSSVVQCWGDDASRQTDAPTGLFTTVTAGLQHSCGIAASKDATYEHSSKVYRVLSQGTIQCWGHNPHGQTDAPRPGDPNIHATATSAPTGHPTHFSAVEVGDNYSCGLRTGGTVVCWGLNNANQASPPANTKFTAISAGQLFTCGLRQDRTIQCWGQGHPPPDGEFRALTVDDNHGCAIKTDGLAVCWVIRDLGSGARAEAPPAVRFADIAASAIHSCGLTDAKPGLRSVECWGDDEPAHGFSGGGQVSDRPRDRGFLEVAADSEYACAIRTIRTIICWGGDDIRGRPTGRTTPPPSDEFRDVAPGHQHACGIRVDGSIACWGRDTDKVLSDAPTSGTFTDISSGDFHSCALRDNGTIECWGRNNYGQTDVP